MSEHEQIEGIEAFRSAPEEFQEACRKIVISHAINELYGSRVYDEPAIALAPTPYAKWLTCRVVMEEYGHHYHFFELGRELGVAEDRMLPEKTGKSPLSIMNFEMTSWEEFCVIKMLGDLGEILQVEDLVQCSFIPLRNLARMTMPEEHFHAEFGLNFCTDLCETNAGKELIQQHINTIFPHDPAVLRAIGLQKQRDLPQVGDQKTDQRGYARRLRQSCPRHRRGKVGPHIARF